MNLKRKTLSFTFLKDCKDFFCQDHADIVQRQPTVKAVEVFPRTHTKAM